MLADQWLWNTMVVVARASSLLDVFNSTVPELVACFAMLQRYMGSHIERTVAAEVYRIIPSLNFSASVLARQPELFLASPIRGMYWSDWGNQDRIVQTISALRHAVHPSLKLSERCARSA